MTTKTQIPTKLLTPTTIDRMAMGERFNCARAPGLSIEAAAPDRKVWRFYRRLKGDRSRFVREKIGTYPRVAIGDAQARAFELIEAAEQGINPNALARAERAKALTVAQAHDLYVTACQAGHTKKAVGERALKDKRHIWHCDIEAPLGRKLLNDVTSAELWSVVMAKGDTTKVRANRLNTELRAFFGWCASLRGENYGVLLANNPAAKLEGKPFREGSGRERILSDAEIVTFLKAATSESPRIRRALLIYLLTGVRKLELLEAPTASVSGNVWTITKTKNGDTHVVAVGPWGERLLVSDADWIIPSTVSGKGLIHGWSRVLRRLNARMAKLSEQGEAWKGVCLHDLRRTMRSNLDDLDIAFAVAEHMLNHKLTATQRAYVRKNPAAAAEGWSKWEAKVVNIARKNGLAEALDIPLAAGAVMSATINLDALTGALAAHGMASNTIATMLMQIGAGELRSAATAVV